MPQKFYRDIDKIQTEVKYPPSMEAMKNPKQHNENIEWTERERDRMRNNPTQISENKIKTKILSWTFNIT